MGQPSEVALVFSGDESSDGEGEVNVNKVQRRNQRVVADVLGKPLLITSIDVDGSCFIDVRTTSWEEYWGCCDCATEEIGRLHAAWNALIEGGYR